MIACMQEAEILKDLENQQQGQQQAGDCNAVPDNRLGENMPIMAAAINEFRGYARFGRGGVCGASYVFSALAQIYGI